MGTALIYPQSGAKELFENCSWNIVLSFFVVRMKKGILRAVNLSINKAFIKPILTFWPFKVIENLNAPGPFDRDITDSITARCFKLGWLMQDSEYIIWCIFL